MALSHGDIKFLLGEFASLSIKKADKNVTSLNVLVILTLRSIIVKSIKTVEVLPLVKLEEQASIGIMIVQVLYKVTEQVSVFAKFCWWGQENGHFFFGYRFHLFV